MAKLHFYYSAMNAGKTTTLLQASYNYQERGMRTILYKPQIDQRDSDRAIRSRIGLEEDAILFSRDYDFFKAMDDRIKAQTRLPHCVFIDEAQFLSKPQVLQLCRVVDELDVPVLCYGLRTDFLGEPFEGSLYLLGMADSLKEIKAICHCGAKATMNLRVDDYGEPVKEGEQIEIGGNERYISVCRRHFTQALNDHYTGVVPMSRRG